MSDLFMNKSSDDWNKLKHLVDLSAENARLKAELAYDKRVQLHVDKLAAEFTQSEVERLKADNERLRKAGDAMAEAFNLKYPVAGGLINAWNAAKEGKPQ